jgi:Ni,Fe-hydrogenase I cytochrome b subunit
MTDQTQSVSKRQAPGWGVWIFGLAIPIAIWSMLSTFAMAMGIAPLFDLTPALVLGIALLTRRWDGVATRWFAGASILAGVMALQWIPWYWWMLSGRFPGSDALNNPAMAYAIELLVLVILVIVASGLSIRGIRRSRTVAAKLETSAA